VFDRQLKVYSPDFIGYVGAQDGLTNCKASLELNGKSTLKFTLPLASPKWDLFEGNVTVQVDGREYVFLNPNEFERARTLDGTVYMSESWNLLGRAYPTVGSTDYAVIILSGEAGQGGFPAGSAGSALYRLLNGTDWTGRVQWTVGTVDVDGFHDLETEKQTLLENIHEVQKTWGGWLVFDSINHTISLRDNTLWANDTGFEIRYKKNEKSLKKIEDWEPVVTRLIPFGEKDLDISSVNGGVKYLENFTYVSEVRERIHRWENIVDPDELKATATTYLNQYCRPQVQYESEMVDLRTLSDYSHELLSLGDIVTIQDEDLADAVKVRLISHSYDVVQPWNCKVKLGDPMSPLLNLAESARVSNWVSQTLKPSKGVRHLYQGVIDTFSTIIQSSNGKVVWSDSYIDFIEIDGGGVETGNRMRLTSGGLGISTNSGQTYVTAITGEGILADKILVNDLFALSSEDTYTKMNGSGVHVYDDTETERLHLGHWNDGSDHYGLKVKNEQGDVVLDDEGILQTWQDHLVDNVDDSHGLELNLYLPSTTLSIVTARLRLKLKAFRAYEEGAASGGGATTPSGGGSTSGASSTSTTASGGGATSGASSTSTTASGGGGTSGSSSTTTTFAGGAHRHIMFDPTGYSAGTLPKREFYAKKYDQSNTRVNIESESSATIYTHGQDQDHTHGMEHTHTVPNHTHDLEFGIYEDTTATGVTVTINGTSRTVALGGPFSTDQNDLDISAYLVAGQWNTIVLGSTRLGRIDATVFLQAKMTT